jgi:cytochrome c oxidase cbb3-type subunit I/II
LHTNAVIFAFVGNAIFAGVYYSTQRLLKARMWSDFLSNLNFWGWQAIIVGAAITLPLGYTTSKEYAELEWPFDIAIAVIWVAFGFNYDDGEKTPASLICCSLVLFGNLGNRGGIAYS